VFEIGTANVAEMRRLRDWAADEGWNPGLSDGQAFFTADPHGFLVGRLDGVAAVSISAVRYGPGHGFIGFYIARPEVRGQGYAIQVWRAGMARLAGRNVGLDGVVEQQDNYRRSGFRRAWNHVRHEDVPGGAAPPRGVTLADARTIPFDRLAAYDRRFFPAPRDAFLAAWLGLPDRTALAAVRDGEVHGLGVVRPSHGAARIGPLHASTPDIAAALG
jgi:Acetyltransferase (GNAT) domain